LPTLIAVITTAQARGPFAELGHAGQVATRTVEALDQAGLDRIETEREHDRDGGRRGGARGASGLRRIAVECRRQMAPTCRMFSRRFAYVDV
jgi:hypothetical protein